MASANVMSWIRKNKKHIGYDALEVGSKKYKEHAHLDLRRYVLKNKPGSTFIGCDISSGENVDKIVDLTLDYEVIIEDLAQKSFDTIFCVSVLEHVPDVFSMSRNLSMLLAKGGAIFISVPFVFRYHGYPGDLWRFTPEAISYLFQDIDFEDLKYSNVSTLEERDSMRLNGNGMDKLNRFLYRPKNREEKNKRKQLKAEGDFLPYSLAPSMINMLGFKK